MLFRYNVNHAAFVLYPLFRGCLLLFFFTIRECQSHTYKKAQTNPAEIREQETRSGFQAAYF